MTSLIRYLLLFLAGLLLARLVLDKLLGGRANRSKRRRASGRAKRHDPDRVRTISGKMVRDPQCGMHVAQNLAITARSQGEQLYFCSADCRDAFFEKMRPTGTDV
ncbi:MAG TPA: hypothetical protein VLU25_20875 [Acidobacteriota bacterium]|nr:hypothetical protein [Acidobacteriota bacterium]